MPKNKTGAIRVGEFGSVAEFRRYQELQILEGLRAISDLSPHPSFNLVVNDCLIGTYTADSQYIENGKTIIEEVKGWKSRDYPLRKKLFKALHPQFVHREIDASELWKKRRSSRRR